MVNPKFLIIATGWNCAKFVQRCLDSIKEQTYTNYEVVLVDDGSTDNTHLELVKHSLSDWIVVKQNHNEGTYYARDHAIKKALHNDVIVMLDMDDALTPDALAVVAKEYEKDVWMTYGNYKNIYGLPCSIDINHGHSVHENRSYRKDTFRCTHLRTFRRELYDAIPKWELTKAEVNSYPDVEILFSMMEMCGKEKIGVIQKPIYIYNTGNPMSTLNRFGKDHPGYYEICNRPIREQLTAL